MATFTAFTWPEATIEPDPETLRFKESPLMPDAFIDPEPARLTASSEGVVIATLSALMSVTCSLSSMVSTLSWIDVSSSGTTSAGPDTVIDGLAPIDTTTSAGARKSIPENLPACRVSVLSAADAALESVDTRITLPGLPWATATLASTLKAAAAANRTMDAFIIFSTP